MRYLIPILVLTLLLGFPIFAKNDSSVDLELSSSQYLSVADNPSNSPTGNLTIMAWINIESQPSSADYDIVTKWTSGDISLVFRYSDAAGTKRLRMFHSDDCTTNAAGENSTQNIDIIPTGEWHHIAGTYSTAGVNQFWVDGVFQGAPTVTNTSICDSTADFRIGALDAGGATNFFDGKVDEVSLWNRILTTSEIQYHRTRTLTGREDGLKAYWRFDGDTPLRDRALQNHLTNNNAAIFVNDIPFVDPKRVITW